MSSTSSESRMPNRSRPAVDGYGERAGVRGAAPGLHPFRPDPRTVEIPEPVRPPGHRKRMAVRPGGLRDGDLLRFEDLFDPSGERPGRVVIFLARLEAARDMRMDIVHDEPPGLTRVRIPGHGAARRPAATQADC